MAQEPGQAYIDILTVAVPPTTKWQPSSVLELTNQLMNAIDEVDLLITANDQAITWGVQVAHFLSSQVSNIFHSFYPQAQIKITPKTHTHIDYYLYSLQALLPFYFRFKYVTACRDLDPLVGLVGSMAHLNLGEEIIYELCLKRPTRNYYKEYEKILKPTTKERVFRIALDAVAYSLTPKGSIPVGYLRPESFERQREKREYLELDRLAREKLGFMCFEVTLNIKIKAATEYRANELANALANATASFIDDNWLIEAGIGAVEDIHPLLLSAPELATFWHLPNEKIETLRVVWSKKEAPLTVDTPYGIVLGTNHFQGKTKEVRIGYDPDREGHVNILGKSGFGKSTLLHNMIHQDIANGKGVGVIDPHGKLVKDILACSIPPERKKDVIIFDVRKTEYPVGLNLLSTPAWVEPEEVASQALAIIRKLFEEQWSKTRMEDALYAALAALVYMPGSTVMDIPLLFLDAEFRYQVLGKVTDPVALEYWYIQFEKMSPAKQQQVAEPIVTRVRTFYRNRKMRRIICQQDSLNFRQIIDEKKIFLASLRGFPPVEAETLGLILVSKLQMAATSRGEITDEAKRFYLTIDEVQNFITTPLDKVFSEARKFGLSLTVANQFLSQLSGPVLDAVLGNVGATIVMQVSAKDAQVVAPSLGGRFTKEDLEGLDKYTAAVTMQLNGQSVPAFSLKTLPPPERLANVDEDIAELYDQSRKAYGQPKDAIDAAIANRFPSDQPPPSTHEDQKEWPEEDEDNNDDLYDEQPPHYDNDD